MANDTPASTAPPMSMGLRVNLSIMMFLQFAIWGAWATVIGNYLKFIKFDERVVGWVGAGDGVAGVRVRVCRGW